LISFAYTLRLKCEVEDNSERVCNFERPAKALTTSRLMNGRYRVTVKERAAQIWPVLAFAAQRRMTLTYDQLGNLIGVPRHGLAHLLAPIQEYCRGRDWPPLTVLVVQEGTGLPGSGFTAAADVPEAQARVFSFNWPASPGPSDFLDT
jgi:hypothetical protein